MMINTYIMWLLAIILTSIMLIVILILYILIKGAMVAHKTKLDEFETWRKKNNLP